MPDIPTGTVTFLFTDIEGSTRLLQRLGRDYEAIQDDHMRLMREAIARGGGTEIRTEGDAFFAVFPTAGGAVQAAVAAQRALHAHPWAHGESLRVRMGMHTGEGRRGGDDYLGIDVNRAARIATAGSGGQILLSAVTRSLVEHELPEGVSLRDLGEHRLKDLAHPEHAYDVVIEGLPSAFPPLKTLEVPTNLPIELTSFVGREREVRQLTDLMDRNRLVTLTGPGGTGKTRLAVEAARQRLDWFSDGVFFVDLSPITDSQLVPDTIASAMRFPRESSGRAILEVLTDQLRDQAALLVLDNFEQVLPGAEAVATILRTAPRVNGVVTSRVPLGVSGEQEFPVPPLELPDPAADPDVLRGSEAVALFAERAAAVDPTFSLTEQTISTVAEICARLDGLPLAIELAASRVRVLPPRSLLEQLGRRLQMLVGGPRDARHASGRSEPPSPGATTYWTSGRRPSSAASPCSPGDGRRTRRRTSPTRSANWAIRWSSSSSSYATAWCIARPTREGECACSRRSASSGWSGSTRAGRPKKSGSGTPVASSSSRKRLRNT